MASTDLTRTPSSASNRKTWTWSGWIKRTKLGGGNQVLFEAKDGSYPEKLQFTADDLQQFTGFTIKIVMISTNECSPVRIKDLRVLALA